MRFFFKQAEWREKATVT